MKHIPISYMISTFVVFTTASVLPTLQLENGFHYNRFLEKTSAGHSSSDHSSFSHNREKEMFSSTYSTKGRRNHMEDYFILSQDCCFAGAFQLYPRSLCKLKSSHDYHGISSSTWFVYIFYNVIGQFLQYRLKAGIIHEMTWCSSQHHTHKRYVIVLPTPAY